MSHRVVLRTALVAAACLLLLAAPARSQALVFDECGDPQCTVDTVNLSTSVDHLHGTLYDPIAADAWWTLVESPNAGLVVPSPAFVIEPISAWGAVAGAGWISAYADPLLYENNPEPEAPYAFERCFCLCEDTDIRIVLDLLIDNVGEVWLDGTLIAAQTDTGTGSFTTPLHADVTLPVSAGEHCLRVELRNLSGVAMGFSLAGSIATVPAGTPIMLSPMCCENEGRLVVCKFKDSDGDGTKDSPAAPLPGFTFTLSPGGHVATTDDAGYAYFNVPAGTYTLTETPQAGWDPIAPPGGTTSVDVAVGLVRFVEFLNAPRIGTVTVFKYLDADCDGLQDDPPTPLSGWTFTATPGGISKTTGANGSVTFELFEGLYTITETPQAGWTASAPSRGQADVVVSKDSSQYLEFLNCFDGGTVTVCKFLDANCDGVKDVGGPTLSGWQFLAAPGGGTQTTDTSGYATFWLEPGAYTIQEIPQEGWGVSSPPGGLQPVIVGPGTSQTVDFLNCPTSGTLAVYKYEDKDCDGVLDPGDGPLIDWLFTLEPGGYTNVTDDNGCALFLVPGGTYTVSETLTGGWTAFSPAGGSASVTVVNGEHTEFDFINCPPWKEIFAPPQPFGQYGPALLWAQGEIQPFAVASFELDNALPHNPAWFVVSFAPPFGVPFHCGTLLAVPPSLLLPLFTDGSGSSSLPFVWPASVPSGVSITVQFLLPDHSAPCGWLISNALNATTP